MELMKYSQDMKSPYSTLNLIRTAQNDGSRLSTAGTLALSTGDARSACTITCDPSTTYQEIVGFGGAITEAAAYNLLQLSAEKRHSLLNNYFDREDGIGYSICRIHMNSSDFSLDSYSCDEVAGDTRLEHFNIERDRKYVIPVLKEAMAINGEMKVLVSPWSPPAWMKTNGDMCHGGKLKDEYRETWARFYVRFIQEYESVGIPIWAISVQNEPLASQTWESCIYTAEEERDFVKDFLGPVLDEAGLKRIKILIWDHNRDKMFERSQVVLSCEAAAKHVWGIGFHWYSGEEFEIVERCHESFPDKALVFTEGCQEGGVELGAWDRGERYARNVIGDLRSWTAAWIDWNIVLDEEGGPNHVGNFCDAPVIVDPGRDFAHVQNSYYYLGHLSKYVFPGAVRIRCDANDPRLKTIGFVNPGGSLVVVVLNLSDETIEYALQIDDRHVKAVSPEHSIETLVSG
jgi:glucosylceramidase